MINVAERSEVIKDHLYIPDNAAMGYNVNKVFQFTIEDGMFAQHMSNFGHEFLSTWDENMILKEPVFDKKIPWEHYVFAAIFVHYWSKALFGSEPQWVHKYKLTKPKYQYDMPDELWIKLAPKEMQSHNWFMEVGGIWYI